MRFLRTNTATRVTVGPFFDRTDGVTPETGITVTSCKLTLMVDTAGVPTLVLDTSPTGSGGANDMVHVTGDDAGFYDLELAAADVNYLGRAMLALTDAAVHCPVFHEFHILPAMIYDSIFLGSDRLDVNVTHVGDTSQTARDIGASVLLSAGTGTGQLDFTSGVVKGNVTQYSGSAVGAPDTAGYPKVTIKSGTGTGEISLSSGGVAVRGHVKKAAAFTKFSFMMTDSTNHNPVTGKTVTATISKDGGSFGSLSSGDSVTEVGNGIYEVDLDATDTNANVIVLRFTAAGSDDTFERIITQV